MTKWKYDNVGIDEIIKQYNFHIKENRLKMDKLFAQNEGLEIAIDILMQNSEVEKQIWNMKKVKR